MPNILVLDYETRSRVNLKTQGADTYATDPSTDILCLAMAFTDTPEQWWLWIQMDGKPPRDMCLALRTHVAAGGLVAAVNARFDRLIHGCIGAPDYGLPPIPLEQWYCVSAQCRVSALPASLDDAARALDTPHKKSAAGDALIRQLCVPQADGSFDNDPAKLEALGVYCVDDVLATLDVMDSCRLLSPAEHLDWIINERINDRGVRVDIPLAQAATRCAAVELEALSKELHQLTNGVVDRPTQHARIKSFLKPRLPEAALDCMRGYKAGQAKLSLDKDIREELLGRHDAGMLELDPVTYNVLAVLHEGSMSSVAKFKTMALRADPETERVHGAFIYAGASTLRFCVAGDTKINVLRPDGLEAEIPITEVMPCDLVWDGVEYVTHEGVCYSGMKETLVYDGVEATYDHKIITEEGAEKALLDAYEAGDRIKIADPPCKLKVNLSRPTAGKLKC